MIILGLRWKLFLHCYWPFWAEPMAYRVKLEWKPAHRCYLWVNTITDLQGNKHRRVIGALQQYPLHEALKMAAQQATDILYPELPTPPAAAAPAPDHEAALELLEGSSYRYKCKCGWTGISSFPGHLCKPEDCTTCGELKAAFDRHVTEPVAQSQARALDPAQDERATTEKEN